MSVIMENIGALLRKLRPTARSLQKNKQMKALEGSSDPLQKSNLTQDPLSKSTCPCCRDWLLQHSPLTVKVLKDARRQTYVVQRSPGENFEIVYCIQAVGLDHHASVIMEYIRLGSKLRKKGKKELTVDCLSLRLLNVLSDAMFKISRSECVARQSLAIAKKNNKATSCVRGFQVSHNAPQPCW